MKISAVITTFNEENTIAQLLDSLVKQAVKPDEIIIVDGGSKDATVGVIKDYQKKDRRIKLIIEAGSIAHGRNTAIKHARFPIIAQIDAGCIAKFDWLAKITEPFEIENVNFVAGFYSMTGNASLQKAVAPFLGIAEKKFDSKTFLPSARSMAFRKSLWEKTGGFSEALERTGEDTLFNYQLIRQGTKIIRIKDAIVYWEMPKTLKGCFIKFYSYAKGDAQVGIWWHPVQKNSTHVLKIVSIFVRYFIGLAILVLSIQDYRLLYILIVGFTLYLLWSVYKMRSVVKAFQARLWIPVIQVSSDIAIMAGFTSGVMNGVIKE